MRKDDKEIVPSEEGLLCTIRGQSDPPDPSHPYQESCLKRPDTGNMEMEVMNDYGAMCWRSAMSDRRT
jgi:hypothetical protein